MSEYHMTQHCLQNDCPPCMAERIRQLTAAEREKDEANRKLREACGFLPGFPAILPRFLPRSIYRPGLLSRCVLSKGSLPEAAVSASSAALCR